MKTISAPTGGARRSWFKWLGLFMLVSNGGFVVAFGLQALSSTGLLAQFCLGTVGGVLLILSGFELPWNVEWYRLAGAGTIFLAASFLLANLFSSNEFWWIVVSLIGSLAIGFFGFDLARGGRHFRVDTDA